VDWLLIFKPQQKNLTPKEREKPKKEKRNRNKNEETTNKIQL
jgi:hypothetical protein